MQYLYRLVYHGHPSWRKDMILYSIMSTSWTEKQLGTWLIYLKTIHPKGTSVAQGLKRKEPQRPQL